MFFMDEDAATALKVRILRLYLERTEAGKTLGLFPRSVAGTLNANAGAVKAQCDFLLDEGYLEKEEMLNSESRPVVHSIRITAQGKNALKTVFNPTWVKEDNARLRKERELKEREITSMEKNSRWVKMGVIVAISLGIGNACLLLWR